MKKFIGKNLVWATIFIFTLLLSFVFKVENQLIDAQGTGSESVAESGEAESVEPIATEQDLARNTYCVENFQKYAEPELQKYLVFMEEHFANKAQTRSLLDQGLERYSQFENDLRNNFSVFSQNMRSVNYDAIDEYLNCQQLLNDYLAAAQEIIKMRATTTSAIKKTSTYIEKYNQINTKLHQLNMEILRMSVNISTFEQKLPCYLKNCV